ncbi:hypothetical protein WJ81_19650 [Burkholderia ubonensis]|nr:hypothetical protein WJ81_19650 [Burkholderia ubonensis]
MGRVLRDELAHVFDAEEHSATAAELHRLRESACRTFFHATTESSLRNREYVGDELIDSDIAMFRQLPERWTRIGSARMHKSSDKGCGISRHKT